MSRRPGIAAGDRLTIVAVAALGVLAALHHALAGRRPAAPELRAATEIAVTRATDAGPGSLREAILEADRARGRVRIVLRVDVVLTEGLPALLNPDGIVVDGGETGRAIDATRVAAGPVFDLAAGANVLRRLRIRGAPAPAVLVRAGGARLLELELRDAEAGVRIAPGTRDVVLSGSTLRGGGIGLDVGAGATGVVVERNRFAAHDDAAVRAVASRPEPGAGAALRVRGNRFADDRISLVLANLTARVVDNDFRGAREAAVYLLGSGATVARNRIRDGERFGILADAATGALIERNELAGNRAAAIQLRATARTIVRGNRIYSNGYGLVTTFDVPGDGSLVAENLFLDQRLDAVLVLGGSPTLRRNRALDNRRAAIRILDYAPAVGPPLPTTPVLDGNVAARNGADAPARERYSAGAPAAGPPPAGPS